MSEITKSCFKCNIIQPLTNFYKHPQMPDGHVNKCKECNKKDTHDHYITKREYYAEKRRERRQDPKRKRKHLDTIRKYRLANPDKYKAQSAVNNALRSGKLTRQPCEQCGDVKSQGHHDDYSKPLDVRWLCFTHHREHHGQQVTIK